MTSTGWSLDPARGPGPDRRRWGITRDIVAPSPDGRLACVLYSCTEVRLHWDVGLLTLLAGPPATPTVLLQPRGLTCVDWSPSPSAQWLRGSRVVAVTAYQYRIRRNRVDLALMFLDTTDHTFALSDIPQAVAGSPLVEMGDEWVVRATAGAPGAAEIRITPDKLTWKRWRTLRWWSWIGRL